MTSRYGGSQLDRPTFGGCMVHFSLKPPPLDSGPIYGNQLRCVNRVPIPSVAQSALTAGRRQLSRYKLDYGVAGQSDSVGWEATQDTLAG